MGHKNQFRSRKRKFTGNLYRNKRSSIDSQAKNDTTVASNIEMKTASASKLEELKDNFFENSRNCDEIFGHRIFDVTTLLSVFAVLCCLVCLHDELGLTEDSRGIPKVRQSSNLKLKLSSTTIMRARNYYAHPNIRDHWALRCMNKCPDLVVCLKRDLQCLRPQARLVLIYRLNVAGMKGRVDLAQPVNRTPDLCDEAKQSFCLNGYVNIQNCRIWSETNPQLHVETPLHPEKLTVWCALWAGGIIGPYFFKNNEGHNVTVNGDRYRAMINNFFIPELNNHDV
ncbi:putative transposable element [Trichonephila clavipes]|nr:putative transposable element [Trichonephila clavipes]